MGLQSRQDWRAAWIQHMRLDHWAIAESWCTMQHNSIFWSSVVYIRPWWSLSPWAWISFPGQDRMPPGIGFGNSQEIHFLDPNSAKHTWTSVFVYSWSEHKNGCALSNILRTRILPSAFPLSLCFQREHESFGSTLVQSGVVVML